MKLLSLSLCMVTIVASCHGMATEAAHAILRTKEAQLSDRQKQRIEQLFKQVKNATDQTRIMLAQNLDRHLEQERTQTEQAIEKIDKEGQQVSRGWFYLKYLLTQQHNYLENYVASATKNESWFTTVSRTLRDWFRRGLIQLKHLAQQPQHDPLEQLIKESLWYVHLERKKILSDYDALLSFIVRLKKHPLSDPLNFWGDETIQKQLKKRVKKMGPEISIQGFLVSIARFAADFAVQGVILAGLSQAWSWVDQDDAKFFDQLNKNIQGLTDEYSEFQQQQAKKQNTAASNIISTFTTAQQRLKDENQATNELLNQEIAYLNKSINLARPAQRYLLPFNQTISLDTLFERSPMYAPDNGYPWFNIYQAGDWEFDLQSSSFWQYRIVPFGTPFWQNGKQDPASNSIFCEYITDQTSYTIEAELTLIGATYPFVAGIIFNRSRWISGDPERLWSYRLVGLYGTETTQTDTTVQSISLVYGQQDIIYTPTPETIVSPLETITTKPQRQPFELPQTIVQALKTNPQTFTISITTNATSVSYTLSHEGKQLFSTTLPGLNPYFFVYHGIGFMAPGCQAQFKLTKPTELVYTKQQRDDFDTRISTATKAQS